MPRARRRHEREALPQLRREAREDRARVGRAGRRRLRDGVDRRGIWRRPRRVARSARGDRCRDHEPERTPKHGAPLSKRCAARLLARCARLASALGMRRRDRLPERRRSAGQRVVRARRRASASRRARQWQAELAPVRARSIRGWPALERTCRQANRPGGMLAPPPRARRSRPSRDNPSSYSDSCDNSTTRATGGTVAFPGRARSLRPRRPRARRSIPAAPPAPRRRRSSRASPGRGPSTTSRARAAPGCPR